MASAQTLIDRALRLLGATASGESPTAQESADALISLNNLLESWQADKQLVYALTDTAFTVTAGDGSYTVGPASNFALTPRPPKLENIFMRASGYDYPIELVEQDRWFNIIDKASDSDLPIFAYYDTATPVGNVLLWPVPTAAHSLHIVTWTPCSVLAALSTTVAFPPGWERALSYNLAVELASEFDRTLHPSVPAIAVESKATIMRANHRDMIAYTELGRMFSGRHSNIVADTP
jgi:hypothetical protein